MKRRRRLEETREILAHAGSGSAALSRRLDEKIESKARRFAAPKLLPAQAAKLEIGASLLSAQRHSLRRGSRHVWLTYAEGRTDLA